MFNDIITFMFREVIKTKIKNLIITDTIESNENIILLDADIVDLIDVIDNDIVHILNVENGYTKDVAIKRAPRGSGIICLHIASYDRETISKGDSISLIVYGHVEQRLINQYSIKDIDYKN